MDDPQADARSVNRHVYGERDRRGLVVIVGHVVGKRNRRGSVFRFSFLVQIREVV
jgi:hypothetical protein